MKIISTYWSAFAGVMACGVVIFTLYHDNGVFSIRSFLWLHFATLLLHQFEEYSYPGRFKHFYNNNILNKNPITSYPLNNKGILLVNVVLAWSMYLLAAFIGIKVIWLSFGLLGITISNGILHTFMFVKLKKYNPGLLTGAFILIPFGIYLFIRLVEFSSLVNIVLGLAVFIIGAALIPLSIFITSTRTNSEMESKS
jgi:hypothetical protein